MARSIHQIIDEQIKRWELIRLQTPERMDTCLVVTISRECGSQGQEVAQNLARKTGFDFFHNEILEAMIQSSKASKALLETLDEKDFFTTFITVDAIGPMKAVKAMTRSAGEIALAIEQKDTRFLTGLSGIGKRTAEKIIATLNGKVERFIAESVTAGTVEEGTPRPAAMNDIEQQVSLVLVEQLGHSPASAGRMIKEAFERNPAIASPEDLFDEIYQEG